MTTFYIVRHGQTDWNFQGKIQGHADISLNNKGREEVALLAKKLGAVSFDACFSSDLSRAQETALILNTNSRLPVKTDQRLRERNFKTWEGRSGEDYIAAVADKKQMVESNESMQERIFQALTEIALSFPQGNVLIVTHGGVLRTILKHILAFNYDVQEITTSNTSILKIHFFHNVWTVEDNHGIKMPCL